MLDDSLIKTRRLIPKLQIVYNILSLQSREANSFDILYRPANCASNLLPVVFKQNINNVCK